jgi:branched-chain amino acid transport system substrate-binding protein
LLGASVLAACTSPGSSTIRPASPSSSTAPITIGASLSLTGTFSADGQAFERGYELRSATR